MACLDIRATIRRWCIHNATRACQPGFPWSDNRWNDDRLSDDHLSKEGESSIWLENAEIGVIYRRRRSITTGLNWQVGESFPRLISEWGRAVLWLGV